MNEGRASEDNALIFGRELLGQKMHIANDAEAHLRVLFQGKQLVSLGCAMDVDAVVTIPHIVERHPITGTIGVHHGQHAKLSRAQKFQGPRLVHQSVPASDSIIYILHIFLFFGEKRAIISIANSSLSPHRLHVS